MSDLAIINSRNTIMRKRDEINRTLERLKYHQTLASNYYIKSRGMSKEDKEEYKIKQIEDTIRYLKKRIKKLNTELNILAKAHASFWG